MKDALRGNSAYWIHPTLTLFVRKEATLGVAARGQSDEKANVETGC
jgi:hypothetical protein